MLLLAVTELKINKVTTLTNHSLNTTSKDSATFQHLTLYSVCGTKSVPHLCMFFDMLRLSPHRFAPVA